LTRRVLEKGEDKPEGGKKTIENTWSRRARRKRRKRTQGWGKLKVGGKASEGKERKGKLLKKKRLWSAEP